MTALTICKPILAETVHKEQALSYHFTRNEDLLKQYFAVRESVYIETFHLTDFADHYDEYDFQDYTDILVVRMGDKVIGGSRLTIHYQGTNSKLPMEADDFLLPTLFPEMQLENKNYSEITRMAILPEYRNGGTIASNMFWLQFARAVEVGTDYMFTVTPIVQGRNNRRHFQNLGYNMHMLNHINVPDKESYEGRKMYLAITEIKDKMPVIPNT